MEHLHYLLMKAHSMFSRRVLSEAAKLGLTPGQPKILEFLLAHQEADQKTIAAHCEIEPATVGSILLRMEQANLVTRTQHEGNRRSLFASLTREGRQRAEEVEQIFRESEAPLLAALSEEEAVLLKELLSRLCRTMEENFEREKEKRK